MTRPRPGGSDDLYQEILRDFGQALLRVAALYERETGRREELFQDICLALWRALDGFERRSSLRTFVFRIAHNRGLSHRWRLHRTAAAPLEAAGDPPDPSPGPEESALAAQRRRRLRDAVGMLPLNLRQVIALTLDGLSRAEISEVLGISQNNVAVRLTRARARLRELMARQGGMT
jgi:RNA polymerase sigma-70 factor (ECF subfamily)